MKTLNDIQGLFPTTLDEALALLAEASDGLSPLAGGTDLMVQWQAGVREVPDRVMSVLGIPELRGIRQAGEALEIGAAVTHAELVASPEVRRHAPALAQAAATIGAAQIQSRGTIAGSVANASPAGDLAPALVITDGWVIVASQAGERQVALTDFFLDYRKIDLAPHELIVRFVLPSCGDAREAFHKKGCREAQAISKIMGAYRGRLVDRTVEQVALALGSVAPTVVRLTALEEWLSGRTLDAATIDEAAVRARDIVTPIADIRSTAEYRRWVSGELVRTFLEELA
jgi:CO/xanthine dehydrogenase FAD-binding subunit